jgi:hypothetical protein
MSLAAPSQPLDATRSVSAVRRELKAGLLGVALLGLLLAVALAARGGHPSGNGEVVERSVPHALQDSLVTLVAVSYGLLILGAVLAAFRFRGAWREPESHWLRNVCVVVAFTLAITIGYWAIARRPHRPPDERARIAREQRPVDVPPRGRVPIRQAKFNWALAISFVGLVVIGGTVIFLRLRRPPPRVELSSVEHDLAEVVETTIDDLRRERDARRAVIAAYANMERVLTSHGYGRHRAETPFEYLAHILAGLDVREGAVRLLTQLFEYAKFSPHEIDSAMKEEAIAALENVRDDLRQRETLAA